MAKANPTDPGDSVLPGMADARAERAVLATLLAERPTQLTIAELVRQLTGDPSDFAERDAVQRAVRDLAGVGLLHRRGDFVFPSRAALRFGALETGGGGEQHR